MTERRDDLQLVLIDDNEPEFVIPDLEAFFSDFEQPALVAAAPDSYDGAMIALVPTDEDAKRIAADDGLPLDDLHLTLCYLGPASKITSWQRDALLATVHTTAENIPVVDADAFAVSLFNPTNADRDTCVVLLVSGDELTPIYREVSSNAATFLAERYPEQHQPWIPHITLTYTDDSRRVNSLKDRTGPIRFDRIRVSFAGENHDFPLYSDSLLAHGTHNQKDHGNRSARSLTSIEGLTKQDLYNVESYQEYSDPLNNALRAGGELTPESREIHTSLKKVLSSSKLDDDVAVFRGMSNPSALFGKAWNPDGDNTGLTWRDDAFMSATTNERIAQEFAEMRSTATGSGEVVIMNITASTGTRAVKLNTDRFDHQGEVLLDSGLTYRIVGDSGPQFGIEKRTAPIKTTTQRYGRLIKVGDNVEGLGEIIKVKAKGDKYVLHGTNGKRTVTEYETVVVDRDAEEIERERRSQESWYGVRIIDVEVVSNGQDDD